MIKSIFNFRLFFIPAVLLAVLQPAADWLQPHLSGALGGEEAEVTLAITMAFAVTIFLYFLVCLAVVAFLRWKQGTLPDGYQLLHFAIFYEVCVMLLTPYYLLMVSWLDGTLGAFTASLKQFAAAAETSVVSLMFTFGFTTILSMLVSVVLMWVSLWLAGKVLGIFWKSGTPASV